MNLFNIDGTRCVNKTTINTTCSTSYSCQNYNGLSCSGLKCVCGAEYYWVTAKANSFLLKNRFMGYLFFSMGIHVHLKECTLSYAPIVVCVMMLDICIVQPFNMPVIVP
jgi:hypothetical protein